MSAASGPHLCPGVPPAGHKMPFYSGSKLQLLPGQQNLRRSADLQQRRAFRAACGPARLTNAAAAAALARGHILSSQAVQGKCTLWRSSTRPPSCLAFYTERSCISSLTTPLRCMCSPAT